MGLLKKKKKQERAKIPKKVHLLRKKMFYIFHLIDDQSKHYTEHWHLNENDDAGDIFEDLHHST